MCAAALSPPSSAGPFASALWSGSQCPGTSLFCLLRPGCTLAAVRCPNHKRVCIPLSHDFPLLSLSKLVTCFLLLAYGLTD